MLAGVGTHSEGLPKWNQYAEKQPLAGQSEKASDK